MKSLDRKAQIALLWRGDRAAGAVARNPRLERLASSLAANEIQVTEVVYSDDSTEEIRAELLKMDGVLVWVDPLSEGASRVKLDALLREIGSHGVWVSAHPDVILKMGVKEVLHRTRHLGWGTDTVVYRSAESLRAQFPGRLKEPKVLKRNRGNGGQGVWKVERVATHHTAEVVRVLEARRGSVPRTLPLSEFIARCEHYFHQDGCVVEQPFQARLAEGMIRCYVSIDRVVGFGHQLIKALLEPPVEGPDSPAAQPGPRIMHSATAPQFQQLRSLVESQWIPQMIETLHMRRDELPVIWDADFLLGARTRTGADTYVLCEINISSVLPFPDEAVPMILESVAGRLNRGE